MLNSRMIPQHNITLSKENVEEHITDKRRKNIELRLVSVDEPPQKRRELHAEMNGIEFCISVMNANRQHIRNPTWQWLLRRPFL